MEAAEKCVGRGILSIVVIAQGFGELGAAGQERDKRLLKLSRDNGAAIVGPNTNGLLNISTGLCLSLAPIVQYRNRVLQGSVGVISQSGAMVSSLMYEMYKRRVGIDKAVTCGNELTLTMSDYLEYMCNDEKIKIVALYIETIRDPDAFRRALRYAHSKNKTVIAIKVGRSEQGQKATLSHTGAIAGSYRNTIALLKHYHVYIADDLKTLASLAECLQRFNWRGAVEKVNPFVASISGGFAALCADQAASLGISLKDPSEACNGQLEALPTQSHGVNPYDMAAQHALIPDVVSCFCADGYNVLIFGLALMKPEVLETVKEQILLAKDQGMDKIILISPSIDDNQIDFFNAQGIIIHDSEFIIFKALLAINKRTEQRDWIDTPASFIGDIPTIDLPKSTELLNEVESKKILNALGMETPKNIVLKVGQTIIVPSDLNYPLVMKGLSNSVTHKTERGLLAIDLRDKKAVDEAWARISQALTFADPEACEIMIEEFVITGLEAILGIQRDPTVGPVVVVGAGGILCELIDDNVVLIPPFSAQNAKRAILQTKFGKLCSGFRGKAYDLDALASAASMLGRAAIEYQNIQSIDINPVLIQEGRGGLIAVDAAILLEHGSPKLSRLE